MKLYDRYPDTVEVDGCPCRIETDFRAWIRFHDLAQGHDRDAIQVYQLLSVFTDGIPDDLTAAVMALCWFYSAGSLKAEDEQEDEPKASKPLYDFGYDADYFIAGFKECYGINLLTVRYMHWWEFLALFRGLNSRTELKQRIQLRGIDVRGIKDRKEKARIRRAQMSIALPADAMSDEDIGGIFSGFF